MNGQGKEDLAQVENFSFNLRRLHLLHQCVVEFQSTGILSLMGLSEDGSERRTDNGEVKQQVIDNI
jgi:hypothetical protein